MVLDMIHLHLEIEMAKNTDEGFRRGSINDRTQFEHNGTWFKRDRETGQIMDGKADGEPFKGVAKEEDHRRH
jgi:hypothetical protein